MFEISRGREFNNGNTVITDRITRRTGFDSALHIAMQIVHTGWFIAYMSDDLVVAEFGCRWIQITRI